MGKKLYLDNTIKSDNTRIDMPLIPEDKLEYIPSWRQKSSMAKRGYRWDNTFKKWIYEGLITDLGGEPSTKEVPLSNNYFHWWRGAKDRWLASMSNGTNPYHGIRKTIVPAAEGAFALTSLRYLPTLAKTIKSKPLRTIWNVLPETVVGFGAGKIAEEGDKAIGGDGSVGFTLGGLAGINLVSNWFNRARKAFYRHVTPFGYGNLPVSRSRKFKEMAKETFLSNSPQSIEETPPWMKRFDTNLVDGYNSTSASTNIKYRNLAVRKAMKLEPSSDAPNIYKLNPDGTYSYDIDNVNAIRRLAGDPLIGGNPTSLDLKVPNEDGYFGDVFTGNGGYVGISRENGNTYMVDTWDLLPFSDYRTLWRWGSNYIPGLRKFEVVDFLRGDPFKVKHKLAD